MPEVFDVSVKRNLAPGEDYFRRQEQSLQDSGALVEPDANHMDGEEARRELSRLLQWWYYERDRQAENRMEMSLDADFYDGLQWSPEDAATLRDRGQMPLVYNEVAPMVDWLIGTERRSRVDWRVMPRTENDVELADVKTKVLKYVSDINRVTFVRSRAFSDAVKVGVGWMDDGVRDDPTQDVLYCKYEDWRNVLWDSASYEPDLSDARYVFRWRWVDEDVALMMFPGRADKIREAVEDLGYGDSGDGWEEDGWRSGLVDGPDDRSGVIYASGTGAAVDARRRRVKLIECQYRKPATVKIVAAGPLQGAILDPGDTAMVDEVVRTGGSIIDKVMMRVHVAVFTPSHMISIGPSIFRHNRFSLTPIWCYRRGRDRLPYGVVRRVRDVQQDMNKRASKALFLLNTNQIIADEGATDDWNLLRDEADRPDGTIIKKSGKDLSIRRDAEAARGQIEMMTLAAQSIQKSAGVSNENLGRQTNASSGEAIKARQLQGSVVTTEPFDNLRLATQAQGEKQLSLVEQWYSEQKVIRLTGVKDSIEWVRINEPEQQPDGSVRFLNDITASMADFVVADQDYAGTLRQVMFEALNNMASRLPPEVALRLMTIALEFSDMPNKDAVAEQIRKVTGEPDPNKQPTPQEAQALALQQQQQQEVLQMQRQQAIAALQEQQAKTREINAKAAKLESDAGGNDQLAAAIKRVREQADAEIERVSEQLRKTQAELQNRALEIQSEANTDLAVARIEADTEQKVAAIQAASDARIAAMRVHLDGVDVVTSMADSPGT